MWDLPRPGLEPVCPALAGRFLTTVPPGKSSGEFFFQSSAKEWLLRGNILQLIQAEWVVFPSLFPQETVPTARVIFTVTIFTAVALYSFYCNNFVEGMNSVRAESSHSSSNPGFAYY